MSKEDAVHLCNEMLLSREKDEILRLQDHGQIEGHYAKWDKSEKDKYCTISLICRI